MTTRSNEPDGSPVTRMDPARSHDAVAEEPTLERILRGVGPREVPPGAAMDDVRATVEAEWREIVQARMARTRRRLWPLAAGIAAAALGVAVLVNRPEAPAVMVATVDRLDGVAEHRASPGDPWRALSPGTPLNAGDELRTATAARVALTLANGLSLRVDRASQVALNDSAHAALATGAVYVDSGPAAAGPHAALEISTPHGNVSHLGTQYEARLAGDALVVSVREGRVSVARGANRVEGAAGERLVIGDDRPVERSLLASSAASWGWVGEIAPAYRLEGQTLRQFLDWAARETGRDVHYADDAARDDAGALELHGSVEGLTPDQALGAVLATTSLPVTVEPARIDVGDRIR